MTTILDRYRTKCLRLVNEHDEACTKADRYLKRISQLVNIDREQRRRVARLTRSLADSVSKRQAQARTLHEKDLKAKSRNEEIRTLTEFKELMEKLFPDIENNLQTLLLY